MLCSKSNNKPLFPCQKSKSYFTKGYTVDKLSTSQWKLYRTTTSDARTKHKVPVKG